MRLPPREIELPQQLCQYDRHLIRCEHEVDRTCGDRGARHPRSLTAARMLRDDRANGVTNGNAAKGTIIPQTAHDNRERPFPKACCSTGEQPVAAWPNEPEMLSPRQRQGRVRVHDDMCLCGTDIN